jgi:cell division protein FtsN
VGLPRGFAMGVLLLVCTGLVAWYFRSALTTALESPPPVTATESEQSPKPPSKAARESPGKPATEATDRFEFYDMLPDAEVEVAEQPNTTHAAAPPPVSAPGTYVVQAGAFPDFTAAGKVKARLALLGVVSEIQTADSNGALFHRVRIGPIDNLAELNRLRTRLRENGIEHQVIPVGE